jgi:hypothetical protein
LIFDGGHSAFPQVAHQEQILKAAKCTMWLLMSSAEVAIQQHKQYKSKPRKTGAEIFTRSGQRERF